MITRRAVRAALITAMTTTARKIPTSATCHRPAAINPRRRPSRNAIRTSATSVAVIRLKFHSEFNKWRPRAVCLAAVSRPNPRAIRAFCFCRPLNRDLIAVHKECTSGLVRAGVIAPLNLNLMIRRRVPLPVKVHHLSLRPHRQRGRTCGRTGGCAMCDQCLARNTAWSSHWRHWRTGSIAPAAENEQHEGNKRHDNQPEVTIAIVLPWLAHLTAIERSVFHPWLPLRDAIEAPGAAPKASTHVSVCMHCELVALKTQVTRCSVSEYGNRLGRSRVYSVCESAS